jgi:hypothetical protein
MSSFLKFLNTADDEELKELPGIGAALASNIVSARPFSTDDDVLRVKGLDEKLLVKLRAAHFERFQATPEMAGTPTGQAPVPALEERSPEEGEGTGRGRPGFWSRLGRAFVNLVRIFVWVAVLVVVIGGIGAAAYYGIPYLYVRFVQPVEFNAVRIQEMATQQAADLATTSAQVSRLRTELSSLETRVGAAESTIDDHDAAIGRLEDMQATLEQALAEQRSEVLADLDYQVKLARAVELLSRARVYLSQSNFGLARQDVLAARDLLVGLQDAAPAEQLASLNAVIARLDLALGNLPGYPVIAADDLEIAWQVLIDGLPAGAEAVVTPLRVFPTPMPSATQTASPPPTPSPTPTAPPVDTPTAGGG